MPGAERRIAVVVGPGRSGTSTMAGALAQCGYHVPRAIEGDATNPLGFFEPQWVVDLHTRLLRKAGVRTLDGDPAVLEAMERVTSADGVRTRLRTWLGRQLARHERIVVKDPRLVWFTRLWREVAHDLGEDPGFVVMLRHPSEVSSSRAEFYDSQQVSAVAGWINTALITEQLTQGSPRAFVRYPDLTAEWRPQIARVRDELGLALDPEPTADPHPIDDFIDPTLRRREAGWRDLPVPALLADLGDRTYDALGSLADGTAGPDLEELLTVIRSDYQRAHDDALAIASAHIKRRVRDARRAGRTAAADLTTETPAETATGVIG